MKTFLIQAAMILLLAAAVLCFAVFAICALLPAIGWRAASSEVRLPIDHVTSLRVANARVYCMDSGYFRLQVFDTDGEFLRGWSTYGSRIVSVDPDADRLHVIAADDSNYIYTLSGELIRKWRSENSYREYVRARQGANPLQYADGEGYRWQYRSGILGPSRIVRVAPEGESQVIVRDPLYIWAVAAPFPAVFYSLVPLVYWYLRRRRNKRRPRDNGDTPPGTATPCQQGEDGQK